MKIRIGSDLLGLDWSGSEFKSCKLCSKLFDSRSSTELQCIYILYLEKLGIGVLIECKRHSVAAQQCVTLEKLEIKDPGKAAEYLVFTRLELPKDFEGLLHNGDILIKSAMNHPVPSKKEIAVMWVQKHGSGDYGKFVKELSAHGSGRGFVAAVRSMMAAVNNVLKEQGTDDGSAEEFEQKSD